MLLAEISTLLHPPAKLHYVLIAQCDVSQQLNFVWLTTFFSGKETVFVLHSQVVISQPTHGKWEEQQHSG